MSDNTSTLCISANIQSFLSNFPQTGVHTAHCTLSLVFTMPVRPTAPTLRLRCMQTISSKYELICYGCVERVQMNKLLDADGDESGYRDIPGPFTNFPSSLLEDLLEVVNDQRGLPKETLHQLILPQLQVILPSSTSTSTTT